MVPGADKLRGFALVPVAFQGLRAPMPIDYSKWDLIGLDSDSDGEAKGSRRAKPKAAPVRKAAVPDAAHLGEAASAAEADEKIEAALQALPRAPPRTVFPKGLEPLPKRSGMRRSEVTLSLRGEAPPICITDATRGWRCIGRWDPLYLQVALGGGEEIPVELLRSRNHTALAEEPPGGSPAEAAMEAADRRASGAGGKKGEGKAFANKTKERVGVETLMPLKKLSFRLLESSAVDMPLGSTPDRGSLQTGKEQAGLEGHSSSGTPQALVGCREWRPEAGKALSEGGKLAGEFERSLYCVRELPFSIAPRVPPPATPAGCASRETKATEWVQQAEKGGYPALPPPPARSGREDKGAPDGQDRRSSQPQSPLEPFLSLGSRGFSSRLETTALGAHEAWHQLSGKRLCVVFPPTEAPLLGAKPEDDEGRRAVPQVCDILLAAAGAAPLSDGAFGEEMQACQARGHQVLLEEGEVLLIPCGCFAWGRAEGGHSVTLHRRFVTKENAISFQHWLLHWSVRIPGGHDAAPGNPGAGGK